MGSMIRHLPCRTLGGLFFLSRRCQSTIARPLFTYIGEKSRTSSIAIQDSIRSTTYSELNSQSNAVAKALSNVLICAGRQHVVSFLCGNDVTYVTTLLGIWKSGNVAVPLCQSHPPPLLEYYVKDSESSIIITTQSFADKIHAFADADEVFLLEDLMCGHDIHNEHEDLSESAFPDQEALILYTSGTTGSPKGVVHTHNSIRSQINSMLGPWKWSRDDSILHVLPLHHTHGLVNCLLCPLAVGAHVKMLPKFDASAVWNHLLYIGPDDCMVNIFMAVPAVYAKLIEFYRENVYFFNNLDVRGTLQKNIRLMVSGSAALPMKVLNEWESISGHLLLERYGMTEIGMALGNPYETSHRLPGFVGNPFPGLEVRIVESETGKTLVSGDSNGSVEIFNATDAVSVSGDLQVRGSTVFKNYYNKPEATDEEFTHDGWFKTGDIAEYDATKTSYKIVGRSSVDIIKSGGYKIGALDLERILLEHELIKDVAVVGVDDEKWGQKVGAVVVLRGEGDNVMFDLPSLRIWCRERMSSYSIPTLLKVMDELPRNAMGKVNKKQLVKIAFP